MFRKLREPVNGLTHLGAALLALPGVALLLFLSQGDLAKQLTLLLYGLGLVLMFSSSATYHLVQSTPRIMLRLRKVDHSAIYLMIAGTYTPICYHYLSGAWRWGLLATIWVLAIAGIGIKLFVIKAPRWVTAGIYLIMGWLAIIAIQEILQQMPPAAIGWLLAGGIFFTLGAIIYITKWPNLLPKVFGFHEIWHIFVILGGLSHFIMIAAYIARPASG